MTPILDTDSGAIAGHLDEVDVAADRTPVTGDPPQARLDLPAYCQMKRQWQAGEVSDEEWQAYRKMAHEHPCSWLNWF
jgi:hypothetical protein